MRGRARREAVGAACRRLEREEGRCGRMDEGPWERVVPVPFWAARSRLLPGESREPAPGGSTADLSLPPVHSYYHGSGRGGSGGVRGAGKRRRELAEAAGHVALWERGIRRRLRVEEGADLSGVT